ncbi:MAG: type IV pilin [Halobacteriales archaeon]|nr:type IV pilin [Halobacteriales archaeon]
MPRATVPVLGAVLLVGVTVLLAVALTVAATGFAPTAPAEPVVLEATADAVTGRVTLEHVSGPAIDVRRVELTVAVDGEPLARQPPVPFFAAAGFHGGPTGPFNQATDPAWTAGEVASFRVASTNDPPLAPGAELSVTLTRGDRLVARATATVR